MKTFKEFLIEKAPPGDKAEDWIKKNKSKFKDEYGDEWEEVLYATAWKLFGESIRTVVIDEEATSSSTTTSGVANPDSKPIFKKSKFMNHPCLEVDSNTYSNCIQGKVPFKRWKKYIEDDSLESELKKMYHRNKRVLIKDIKTGSMTFLK